MTRKVVPAALAVSLPVLLGALPASTQTSDDITIQITAQVETVDDPDDVLGGAVAPGNIVTGEYTYDANTRDSNAAPTVGDYWHNESGYGIMVDAGGFRFQTDPANVEFLVEIVNDHGNPPSDNYLLRSYNNLPLANGAAVSHISWQLDDPTLTALSSETLPTNPPNLADWQSVFGLSLEGCAAPDELGYCDFTEHAFFIRAHVISVQLAPDSVVPVAIDVKPGNEPNCFNSDGHGVIPVGIMSNTSFDATQVDPTTVTLDGQQVRVLRQGRAQAHSEDVNRDGLDDLVVQIDDGDVYGPGDTTATLTGQAMDGRRIEGTDSICIVPGAARP